VFLAERLDLDVDTGGQVELHQRVDGLRRRPKMSIDACAS
jgi:hypothetical protein